MEVVVKIPKKYFGFRKQGFRFSMETWMMLSDYTQLALNEFGLLDNNRFFPAVCFCAAQIYDKSHNNWKVKYTEKTISQWIERMSTSEAQKIMDTMFQSKIGGESIASLIADTIENEKKKSGLVKSETMQ